jgi:tetratricopeptide (TPR) repeat protein
MQQGGRNRPAPRQHGKTDGPERPDLSGRPGPPERPGRTQGGPRRDRLYFLVLFALAAALRLGYTLASRESPFFGHLDLDTKFYDSWARDIASGNWVGREVFFMGPLYPYFLGLIYKVFGPSLLAAKVIQSLVGSLSAGVIFLLGKECFGGAVGLVAGVLAALYVPFIFTDTLLLFPVLATLLNALMLYWLCRAQARPSAAAFLAGGVFAGLSAAGNASVLAFVPLAVGYIMMCRKWPPGAGLRKAAVFVLGVALVVLPIMVRNYAVGRDVVPLTSNAGLNFYIGNSPAATGAYVKPEGLDIYTDPSGRAMAERALGRQLKPSEVSAWWWGRAAAYIDEHPGQFARNVLRKVFFFWSVYEIPQIEHLPFERQYSWILRIPTPSFGMICPLGIIGAALALRRRKEAWLGVLFMLAYSASIIAFFVVARYRLPMVPALLVFAAYSIVWLAAQGAKGRWKQVGWAGVALVCLYIVVHVNFYRVHPLNGFAQSYYRLGVVYDGKADQVLALENYRRALGIDPSIVPARVNLGILLARRGDYVEAGAELADAVRRDSTYDKAFYNLGLVYTELGKNDSALVVFDRALAVNPSYGLAKLAKGAAHYELASLDAAEMILAELGGDRSLPEASRGQAAQLLSLIPERRAWLAARAGDRERASDRWLLRGDNLASLGLAGRALEAYLRAADLDSLSAAAQLAAGNIYLGGGDLRQALGRFVLAGRAAPRLRGVHLGLGAVAYRSGEFVAAAREFEEELRVDPASAQAHISLAMCYENQLGNTAAAAEHLRRYIELTGGTRELKDHLRDLEARIDGRR